MTANEVVINQNIDNFYGDGIMGLSPRLPDPNNDNIHRDSVIQRFYDTGSIHKSMFSLYLSNKAGKSRIIIGGYDQKVI